MMKRLLLCVALCVPASAVAGIVDANSNGFSDLWEAAYGWENGVDLGSEDYDGDGFISSFEHEFGTSPFDENDRPGSGTVSLVPPVAEFSFPTLTGIRYQPQVVEDLGESWVNVGGPISGDGTTKTVSTTAPAGGGALLAQHGGSLAGH